VTAVAAGSLEARRRGPEVRSIAVIVLDRRISCSRRRTSIDALRD
jgi:hypothetical protein